MTAVVTAAVTDVVAAVVAARGAKSAVQVAAIRVHMCSAVAIRPSTRRRPQCLGRGRDDGPVDVYMHTYMRTHARTCKHLYLGLFTVLN